MADGRRVYPVYIDDAGRVLALDGTMVGGSDEARAIREGFERTTFAEFRPVVEVAAELGIDLKPSRKKRT